jgi:hypothetical protein
MVVGRRVVRATAVGGERLSACRICGLPEERDELCAGHREEWIIWASKRPDEQNDAGLDRWMDARVADVQGTPREAPVMTVIEHDSLEHFGCARHFSWRADCPTCNPAVLDAQFSARMAAVEQERLAEQLKGAVEAFDRIVVACDNGSEPENKLTFIRRVANDARAALRGPS